MTYNEMMKEIIGQAKIPDKVKRMHEVVGYLHKHFEQGKRYFYYESLHKLDCIQAIESITPQHASIDDFQMDIRIQFVFKPDRVTRIIFFKIGYFCHTQHHLEKSWGLEEFYEMMERKVQMRYKKKGKPK